MTNPDFLIRVADWSLLTYCVLLVGVAFWAVRGRLPSALKAKYARGVTYMSQLPFAYRWRQAVSAEDLPVFEKARMRQHIFLIVISSGSLVSSIYGYINSVALLSKCHMNGIGPIHGQ
jgi:hypothetical protein